MLAKLSSFLKAVGENLLLPLSAYRGCEHPWLMAPSTIFQSQQHPTPLWPSAVITSLGKALWFYLLKWLYWAHSDHLNNHSISRFLTLITSAKVFLLRKVTYPQVPGIGHGHLWGAIILPTTMKSNWILFRMNFSHICLQVFQMSSMPKPSFPQIDEASPFPCVVLKFWCPSRCAL